MNDTETKVEDVDDTHIKLIVNDPIDNKPISIIVEHPKGCGPYFIQERYRQIERIFAAYLQHEGATGELPQDVFTVMRNHLAAKQGETE